MDRVMQMIPNLGDGIVPAAIAAGAFRALATDTTAVGVGVLVEDRTGPGDPVTFAGLVTFLAVTSFLIGGYLAPLVVG